MLTEIVARLKSGSVPNVVPFGSSLPSPPYVVVRPETVPATSLSGSTTQGRRFRVIAHFEQGQQVMLEDYLREAISLLQNYQATSRHGAVNRLGLVESITDIAAVSDDATISMEAAFFMPTHTF
jgi:predicted glycosyltransferase